MQPRLFTTLLFLGLTATIMAQDLYFPPLSGNSWETASPAELGWCEEQIPPLLSFLEDSNTKAFIVLKDGRIVLEQYFGTFTADSSWYWASAGKTLTAFLVGLAKQERALTLNDTSTLYLRQGWTTCTPTAEKAITVRNHLTMTTGLDDSVPNDFCTDPPCLKCLVPPDTRWAYHNAPYTLLTDILEEATDENINLYTYERIHDRTGMTGLWVKIGYNRIFFSTARSMARFGLLMLGEGAWDDDPILTDRLYYRQLITPSQEFNPSYGYLWWLNGQISYRLPGSQVSFPGPLVPAAPNDMYAAIGLNSQLINVVPSQGLVVVRMGNDPDQSPVPTVFVNNLWKRLNAVLCLPTSVEDKGDDLKDWPVYPNPVHDRLYLPATLTDELLSVSLLDLQGRTLQQLGKVAEIDVSALPAGVYYLRFNLRDRQVTQRFVKG